MYKLKGFLLNEQQHAFRFSPFKCITLRYVLLIAKLQRKIYNSWLSMQMHCLFCPLLPTIDIQYNWIFCAMFEYPIFFCKWKKGQQNWICCLCCLDMQSHKIELFWFYSLDILWFNVLDHCTCSSITSTRSINNWKFNQNQWRANALQIDPVWCFFFRFANWN